MAVENPEGRRRQLLDLTKMFEVAEEVILLRGFFIKGCPGVFHQIEPSLLALEIITIML